MLNRIQCPKNLNMMITLANLKVNKAKNWFHKVFSKKDYRILSNKFKKILKNDLLSPQRLFMEVVLIIYLKMQEMQALAKLTSEFKQNYKNLPKVNHKTWIWKIF